MKLRGISYLPFIFLFTLNCGNNINKVSIEHKDISTLPLQEAYQYFDRLSQDEFHFEELDHKLNTARGQNNTDEVNNYIKEFEVAQANCIKKMADKFPEGSIKIPFEQMKGKDTITVKSVYISGYSFPWSTAPTICFYFTIEYELHKKDLWFVPILLKFVDSEDDIIYVVTQSANTAGISKFEVKSQFTFRKLKNLIVNQ